MVLMDMISRCNVLVVGEYKGRRGRRRYEVLIGLIVVMLLSADGCGSSNFLRDQRLGVISTAQSRQKIGVLGIMGHDSEIQSKVEANEAKARAIRTELAMVQLLKELGEPGLSAQQRVSKNHELHELRERYRREVQLIKAFSSRIRDQVDRYARILELKDPEIERIRTEMGVVLERKGEDEHEEIRKLRTEFRRRQEELVHELDLGE
jgi:hypothetical protein